MQDITTLVTRLQRRAVPRTFMLTLAAALLAAPGCSSDKGTGPAEKLPAGTYSLHQIDDDAPPVTIHQGPWLDPVNVTFYNKFIVKITGGEVELDDNGQFLMNFTADINGDGQQWSAVLDIAGAYAIEDDEVWFYPEDADLNPVSSPLQNGAITLGIDFMGKGVANYYHFAK